MTAAAYAHPFGMPWQTDRQDTRKFKNYLLGSLLAVLVFGAVMPWLPLPEVPREELEELPPELAKIILEKPKPVIPPPPPPPQVKEEVPPPEKPLPIEETTPVAQPKVSAAKEKAAISGLLAFKDTFADMRESVDVSKLQDTGAIARGAGESATIDRSLLTSKRAARSAGVNVAALSRDTGGVALSGRATTKVDVPEGTQGNGGVQKRKAVDPRSRSIEDIRRVFDGNKGAIFAIYNRALRQDPTLQGKVVLELVIDPNGQVVGCQVVASELADQTLLSKIVNRVRLFNFGRQDVRTTTISYPVHFLPT